MKKLLLSISVVALVTTYSFAKDVIEKFSANGKTYEVYVSNGDVFVTYAGVTDTKYEKGSSGNCEFKRYGSCVSRSDMMADIKNKVKNKKY